MTLAMYVICLMLAALFAAVHLWVLVAPAILGMIVAVFYATRGHRLGVRRPPRPLSG